jgi:hypothetical protein
MVCIRSTREKEEQQTFQQPEVGVNIADYFNIKTTAFII